MDTLSQTLEQLRQQGYTADFNLIQGYLYHKDEELKLFHDEFVVDSIYRFEGDSDPADEATIYAISSDKYQIKGVLVNGAGIYTDEATNEMLDHLNKQR
jgi:hypothetical protein